MKPLTEQIEAWRQVHQPQAEPSRLNRHERRKAAALARIRAEKGREHEQRR